ncbi:MAG: hypothetical protein J0H61_13770, partial [Alphaproteobacteria bacterium]|nr:hypothetical protein [Alphaproteobacteria bacterium]
MTSSSRAALLGVFSLLAASLLAGAAAQPAAPAKPEAAPDPNAPPPPLADAPGTTLMLRGLDKITGRPTDITAPIGKP